MSKTMEDATTAPGGLGRFLRRLRGGNDGSILIVVLFLMMGFFVLAAALLFLSETEHVVAVNEQDHLKTLEYAEAGVEWARRRVFDTTGGFTGLLDGPDPNNAADDYMIGLRTISLTATSQFTTGNETTSSARVTRDFGDGSKAWEVIRVPDTSRTRANVYVRVEDNWDDSPNDPNGNLPLIDGDGRVKAIAIAEYPIFVNGGGAEVPAGNDRRGRALSRVEIMIYESDTQAAIVTDGDLSVPGNMEVCGACGSVHSNEDVTSSGTPDVCENFTASGTYSAGGATVGGNSGGGYPEIPIPIINPYDDVLVPDPNVFDTSGLGSLPAELRCPAPTAADPGRSKYFALVSNNAKGLVYKAYWDFTLNRWEWKLIDNLNDGTDVKLDECGRAPGDPNYTAAVSDKDGDMAGMLDEFYGFKMASVEQTSACTACGSAGDDESLCDIASNDFTKNVYWEPNGTAVGSVAGSNVRALPGSGAGDGTADFNASVRMRDGIWDYGSDYQFAPLYNAVIFVHGSVKISGNPGTSSNGKYCKAPSTCGAAGSIPNDTWAVSLITYGNMEVSGNPSYSPANPSKGYHFLFVAGRDVKLSGNPGATNACPSGCSTSSVSNVDTYSGIIAAHEQISISGNPQILGFLLVEDAIACSDMVTGGTTINGNPSIYYDCNNPPNPWATDLTVVTSWQEVER